MSLSISIRFLTGRSHLHPWQTHHSEGRIEWPPSHWRLLRALVAVAGRGLTSLPYPDFIVDPGKKPKPTRPLPSLHEEESHSHSQDQDQDSGYLEPRPSPSPGYEVINFSLQRQTPTRTSVF
jgi:hypothetical protein